MIILDASFIVKLILEEEESEEAWMFIEEVVKQGEELATMDIALAEVLNAIWKHYTLIKDIDRDVLDGAVSDLLLLWSKLSKIDSADTGEKAMYIAVNHDITIYDSLYLAASKKYGATLATYDDKQREKANGLLIITYP